MKVKVFVAIDIQNLWYTAINAFGKKYRVNFQRLRTILHDNVVSYIQAKYEVVDDINIEAIAYIVVSPDHDNSSFVDRLTKLNYKTKQRYMRYDKNGSGGFRNLSKSDWDVGITVDAMSRMFDDDINLFILVSGDGDYVYLVEEMRRRDVDVDVYTFETGGSKVLRNAATRAFLLDKNVVFGVSRTA